LISKCLLNAHFTEIVAFFATNQYGIANPRGTETIVHVINQILQDKPVWGSLLADISNAFNSIHRQIIVNQLKLHFPSMLPWFIATYSKPNHLWTSQDTAIARTRVEITSDEGVQQGDPISPFLFCLATHHTVILPVQKHITDNNLEGVCLSFMDDTNITAPIPTLNIIFPLLQTSLASVGLTINPAKCKIYNPEPPSDTVATENIQHITMNNSALVLLGGTIGKAEARATILVDMFKDFQINTDKLLQWKDTQLVLIIYRMCVCTKYNYFLRITDPEVLNTVSTKHNCSPISYLKASLQTNLAKILRLEDHLSLPSSAWNQSILAPRQGGLGLLDTDTLPSIAHLASLIECSKDIQKLLNIASPLSTDSFSQLRTKASNRIRELHDELCSYVNSISLLSTPHPTSSPVDSTTDPQSDTNTTNLTPPSEHHKLSMSSIEDLQLEIQVQRKISKIINTASYNKFILTQEASDIIRIQSASEEAAALILTIPYHTVFRAPKDGDEFCAAICMRLGLPIDFLTEMFCVCKVGTKYIDKEGYHLLSQCNVGGQRITRHNLLRDEWVNVLGKAGFRCKIENSATLQEIEHDTNARTDITILNYEPNRTCDLDIAITDARTLQCNSNITSSQLLIPMQAAKNREQSKNRSYKEIIQASGNIFLPLVIESLGRWGPSMRTLFSRISKKLIMYSGGLVEDKLNSHDKTLSYWRARITLTSIFASMKGLSQRMRNINQQNGRCNIFEIMNHRPAHLREETQRHYEDPEDISKHNQVSSAIQINNSQ
jgi:hypothetical protein